MKRLPGVIISAIVLLLGSLLQLLMAVCMVFAGAIEQGQVNSGVHPGGPATPPIPAWMPEFMYGMCAVFVLLALWGILTAIGLFRLRRWARYSVLVIGGCLALVGIPSMLMMLVMTMVALPLPPTVDASQAHTFQVMAKAGLGIGAALYAMMSGVGISWLVYFNRKTVREGFAGAPGQIAESRRPLPISVVAAFSMLGGPSCALMAFLPLPAAFLGLTLHGWGKVAVYLVYAALLTAAGVGLWRLEEWGRRLALAMQVLGLAQFAIYIFHPSLMTAYTHEIDGAMGVTQPQMPAHFQNTMYAVMFGFSALLLLAIIGILIRYRGVFRQPTARPPIESPA
jgi:uncharacterized membrane protein (DUF2068 family)